MNFDYDANIYKIDDCQIINNAIEIHATNLCDDLIKLRISRDIVNFVY